MGKKTKSKKKSRSSSSDDSSSSSDSSHEKKKLRKLKKKLKKEQRKTEKALKKKLREEKRKLKKSRSKSSSCSRDVLEKNVEDPPAADIPLELMEKSKAMAPMTKEEWEKRQSVVRRVLDEESGRYSLFFGPLNVIGCEPVAIWGCCNAVTYASELILGPVGAFTMFSFAVELVLNKLIKGDGEVLEEIVSRDRHKQINRQATQADGAFFQSQTVDGKHL